MRRLMWPGLRKVNDMRLLVIFLLTTLAALSQDTVPAVIVVEGESFKPQGEGWRVIHQEDSYASHTYGGMWVSQGGLLNAAADTKEHSAVAVIDVGDDGFNLDLICELSFNPAGPPIIKIRTNNFECIRF